GCWFSLGARSLATGKGREYIKLVPQDRLLFETDMPWPGDAERGYAAIAESLARAEEAAAGIIGEERVARAQENASLVLSL
ncbi:MAG: TatD family hydrolase, partial [Coriobacteriaceae bacterium]|nr:TatD family hydrolase [Coriobacteriaceae bacterium]